MINMFRKADRYLRYMRSMQRINMALTRGAATLSLRNIDLTDPNSWEFCGFSQNGEDGIISTLTRQLFEPNRYFIEIGTSDGLENNVTWLALAERYSGLMIEGDPGASAWSKYLLTPLNYGVECVCLFVTRQNVHQLLDVARHREPDVFSLDVDGSDFYLMKAILEDGFRPAICVVEYNSAFGPDLKMSVKYDAKFRVVQRYGQSLYYGCSIGAWKSLFARLGYTFVTVDRNGVNAFFIDPNRFDSAFVEDLNGKAFIENFSHAREYRNTWEQQFKLIQRMGLVSVE